MSSYIVPDRNIATLVRHFIDRTYAWPRSHHYGQEQVQMPPVPRWIATIINQNSPNHNYDRAEQALFDALYRMNERAFNGRYSKNTEPSLVPEFPRTGKALPDDLVTVLGVLQNYTYQCAEEPVYKSEEYQQLDDYDLRFRAAMWDASKAGAEGRSAGWGNV